MKSRKRKGERGRKRRKKKPPSSLFALVRMLEFFFWAILFVTISYSYSALKSIHLL